MTTEIYCSLCNTKVYETTAESEGEVISESSITWHHEGVEKREGYKVACPVCGNVYFYHAITKDGTRLRIIHG